MTDELAGQLANLPEKPGVYLMRDSAGHIIYVGKAINLKNRVRSYFQAGRGQGIKTAVLVARVESLETITASSELEALILECNLIKKHRPRYNISLKDDKSYPYLKVTWAEEFPRVYPTRRLEKDGSRYYGPYAAAGAMHEALTLLKRLFPLRTCRVLDPRRPCLEHHIRRCLAPCSGAVSAADYREMVSTVCLFLDGRTGEVEKDLTRRMQTASAQLNYELAARLRDQLSAVRQVAEKQSAITGAGDRDVLGLARAGGTACVQIFFVRSGKWVGRDHFRLSGGEDEEEGEVLAAFIKQYYADVSFIPKDILLPAPAPESGLLEEWLSSRRNAPVHLLFPRRGEKKDMVVLASQNAAEALNRHLEKENVRGLQDRQAIMDLKDKLGLDKPPHRIECFDISHIQGSETVASMVVFTEGIADKSQYRRYKLRTVEGSPDDVASIREVTLRRYRLAADPLPGLIVIDGGRGQLGAALEVIRGVGLSELPVVGLAKEFEQIYREGIADPLLLPKHSPALRLMQRIRDEAHRFAVSYHRKIRAKRNLVSVLDHVRGIGAKRRQSLWQHFGTIARIREASIEELAAAPGVSRPSAEAVFAFFHPAAE